MTEETKTNEGDNGQSPQAPAKKMDAEDRLTSENLQLKLMNIALQIKLAERDLSGLMDAQARAQHKLMAHRSAMEKKYQVDLNKVELRSRDGALVPVGTPNSS